MSAPSTPEPRGAKRVRPEDLVDEVEFGAGPENASPNASPGPVLSPKLTPVNQPISASRTTPPGAPVRKTDAEREQEQAEAAAAHQERSRRVVCVYGTAGALPC